jgi:twitching motility two-component system response regulator PilH
MSEEALIITPPSEPAVRRAPTVYFIDDSATMREVIKIAFRRENINVITCADAASALAQFDQNRPDVVITDVIMPDLDGYAVCSQIKQHPEFSNVPVVLMSGVVNKGVADKAVSVQADELIRKPFQPVELLGRVKSLLAPKDASPATERSNTQALQSLFAPPPPVVPSPPPAVLAVLPTSAPPGNMSSNALGEPAWPRALAEAFTPLLPPFAASDVPSSNPAQTTMVQQQTPVKPQPSTMPSSDSLKLRAEISRLELLVKKLQNELQLEREYNQGLEQQVRNLISQ